MVAKTAYALPDFGLGFKETIIEPDVWERCKDDLVRGQDVWGMVELGYRAPDDFEFEFEYEKKSSKSRDGKLMLNRLGLTCYPHQPINLMAQKVLTFCI